MCIARLPRGALPASFLMSGASAAQASESKRHVRAVLALAAGGGGDAVARPLCSDLPEELRCRRSAGRSHF